jgi:GT2 family glycosyltransferase/actin-like ATPase involved in cell morphogenesis
VCTRDRQQLLAACLASLDEQTAPAGTYDVLVVDNGSTDGTAAFLAAWAAKAGAKADGDGGNRHVVTEPVAGLSRARNAGIAAATGDIVLFLDDDALAPRGWVDAHLGVYRNGPATGAAGGPVMLTWPEGRPAWLAPQLEHWFSALDHGDQAGPFPEDHGPYGTNMSLRRDVLAEVGGFAERLGRRGASLLSSEEAELWRRLWAAGHAIAYEPAALLLHQVSAARLQRRWLVRRGWGQGRSNARLRAIGGDVRSARQVAGACRARADTPRGWRSARRVPRCAATAPRRSTRWPAAPATPPPSSSRPCSGRAAGGRTTAVLGRDRRKQQSDQGNPGGGATAGSGPTTGSRRFESSRRGRVSVGYQLGVDLGTTYTAAAVIRNGVAEVATLGTRSLEIPSVVYLRDDGAMLIGEAAERRSLTEPDRFAREFKRRIGDPTPVMLGGSPFSAHTLMAKLLRAVVKVVADREGTTPDHIVVTHPANWGEYKRELLDQALHQADVGPTTKVTEPEAAAVHYASTTRVGAGQTVAVYDLGGGTFDAAILRNEGVRFTLLGEPQGIEQLGGVYFDDAVFNYVSGYVSEALEQLDPDDPGSVAAVSRLRRDCVEAKEALSWDTDTTIPVGLPNQRTEVRLTRSEFEDMARPALAESIEAMRRALRSAAVDPSELTAVLLVGGSSRIPLVGQMLMSDLQRPTAIDVHPKHAVALGAAHLAAASTSQLVGAPASVALPARSDRVPVDPPCRRPSPDPRSPRPPPARPRWWSSGSAAASSPRRPPRPRAHSPPRPHRRPSPPTRAATPHPVHLASPTRAAIRRPVLPACPTRAATRHRWVEVRARASSRRRSAVARTRVGIPHPVLLACPTRAAIRRRRTWPRLRRVPAARCAGLG